MASPDDILMISHESLQRSIISGLTFDKQMFSWPPKETWTMAATKIERLIEIWFNIGHWRKENSSKNLSEISGGQSEASTGMFYGPAK